MKRRGLLLVTVLGLVLGLAVVPASGIDLAGPDGVADPPVSMAAALTAQADATSDLLEEDGIVGTGVGVGPDDEPHVVVLLETPQDAALVPGSIDGVETETLVTGTLQTFPCPGGATSDCSAPIPGGVSVGHPSITAGTLGAYVQSAQGYFALSNNHVFAAENTASIGDVVLQPGPADGGSAANPSHILGTLAAFEPIVRCDPVGGCGASPTNLIDAAIVAVESDTVQAENICGWTPQATTLPVSAIVTDATELKKCGRTTGETTGTVKVVNATVDVQGTLGVARFTGQLITGPHGGRRRLRLAHGRPPEPTGRPAVRRQRHGHHRYPHRHHPRSFRRDHRRHRPGGSASVESGSGGVVCGVVYGVDVQFRWVGVVGSGWVDHVVCVGLRGRRHWQWPDHGPCLCLGWCQDGDVDGDGQ